MIQKVLLVMIGLAALTHPCAQAKESATPKNVINRTILGEDARALFAALQVPAETTEAGLGKNLQISNGALIITCRQDGRENTACAVTADRDQIANEVLVITGESAQELYEALGVKVFAEMVSDVKIFADANESVSLLCARSLIPNGNPYSCSVELPAR